MTLQEMEIRITNLENAISALAQKSHTREMQNKSKTEMVGYHANNNEESITMNEEITDAILSTILPSQNDSISDIEDVIDNLFTEILPDLLG